MGFDVTPEEAQPCANRFVSFLKKNGERATIEKPAWEDAPYRTTLFTRSGDEIMLYEVQGHLNFHDRLSSFAQWLRASRRPAELHIVTDGDAPTTASQFSQLKKYGVGLFLLNENDAFEVALAARNPALQVNPDPRLRYGDLQHEVSICVEKFNDGARKDGLRDLCELVERETERVLLTASRKGWISIAEHIVKGKDWSDQINTLASANVMTGGRKAMIDAKLRDDLHSFRGARNLVDHQARSKRDDKRRQRQFPERMMMGARLVSDLIALRRKIKMINIF